MKTEDIQRGIRSRPQPQSRGAPMLGQVTRLRHRDDFRGGSQGQGRRGVKRKTRVMMFSALFGLAALVVIGSTVALWLIPRMKTVPVASLPDHESKVRVESRFPSPSREESLDLVRRAVTTRDPRAVASLFRDGVGRSAEILDFLRGMEAVDGRVERYEWLSSMDTNGLLVEGVAVVFKGREKPVERLALLTPDPAGVWQMDFDAFARTGSPSWKELMETATDLARVRVIVSKGVYYNGPFQDESLWTCYEIVSPDSEESLRGYCRVGTTQADAMTKLFSEGEATSRATLELRRVKDAEFRQFEISRVLAKDWILPEAVGGDS